MPPLSGPRQNIATTFGVQKPRMVWLPDDEKKLQISLFVSTEFTNVTDEHTDTQTDTA